MHNMLLLVFLITMIILNFNWINTLGLKLLTVCVNLEGLLPLIIRIWDVLIIVILKLLLWNILVVGSLISPILILALIHPVSPLVPHKSLLILVILLLHLFETHISFLAIEVSTSKTKVIIILISILANWVLPVWIVVHILEVLIIWKLSLSVLLVIVIKLLISIAIILLILIKLVRVIAVRTILILPRISVSIIVHIISCVILVPLVWVVTTIIIILLMISIVKTLPLSSWSILIVILI